MLKSMYGGLYMKVKIGISNRHIHLSQTDAKILFKKIINSNKEMIYHKKENLLQKILSLLKQITIHLIMLE